MNHLIAVVGIVVVGLSPIWVALADVSPATTTFFRSIYALPALTLIWFLTGRGDERSARARVLAVASGFLLAVDLTVWHQSITYIGAGLATILANTQVVFAALLLSERISWLQGLGIFLVVGGVAWVSVKGATKPAKGEQEWSSDNTISKTRASSSSV